MALELCDKYDSILGQNAKRWLNYMILQGIDFQLQGGAGQQPAILGQYRRGGYLR